MKKIVLVLAAMLLSGKSALAEGAYLGDGGFGIVPDGAPTSLEDLMMMIMNFLGVSIVFVSVIGFMVGGAFLIFSAGSENTAEKGKSILLASVIGISVTLLAYIIVKLVQTFLYSLS